MEDILFPYRLHIWKIRDLGWMVSNIYVGSNILKLILRTKPAPLWQNGWATQEGEVKDPGSSSSLILLHHLGCTTE